MSRRNAGDEVMRALERRVLAGDLTAVPALARVYERAGRNQDERPWADILVQIEAMKEAGVLGINGRREIRNAVGPVSTDDATVAEAIEQHQADGDVEIDDNAEISVSDDPDAGGCYVQAWVWTVLDREDVVRLQRDEAAGW